MPFLDLPEKPFNGILINTVGRKRTRRGKYKHMTLQEYKQHYYLSNYNKYRLYNAINNPVNMAENQLKIFEDKATEQELINNIQKMSDPLIIDRLKFLCGFQ
jgi:hypothetical protein